MALPTLYKLPQVAACLGVHEETVKQWIRSGDIEALEVGGRLRPSLRFTEQAVQACIRKREARKQAQPAPRRPSKPARKIGFSEKADRVCRVR